ncbi:MAG: rhodanese-like domain-containing protein, partial [Actinomycetota bacterium]|nr:rhodanese-like domain-containing protein [Actinomycetota bacterium]
TNELQIIDVRHPHEWEAGRIEGARHIPLDELAERLEEIDPQRAVVTVCRSGARSGKAAELLQSQGFEAQNLEGGIKAWADEGFAVTTPEGRPGTVAEVQPPGKLSPELQQLQNVFMEVAFAAQERFGERQPSEEEMDAFLRDHLIAQGKTPEEADVLLAELSDRDDEAAGN